MNTSVDGRIRERLAQLEPSVLDLVDESARHAGHAGARAASGGPPHASDGTHWRLRIVSARFAGKPTVARHRMIYDALGELMQDPIHALAITARAPGEPG